MTSVLHHPPTTRTTKTRARRMLPVVKNTRMAQRPSTATPAVGSKTQAIANATERPHHHRGCSLSAGLRQSPVPLDGVRPEGYH